MLRHTYFNSTEDSDIVVKFDNRKIAAHKIMLKRSSGYFRAAFSGGFSVATSEEIDLGEEDKPEAVDAMLRHIYGLDFISHRDPEDREHEWINFLIDVFEVSDKYDVPTLSDAVIENFEKNYIITNQLILGIQRHCGPAAKKLADKSLQRAMMRLCCKHMSQLVDFDRFKEFDQKGELLDPTLSARLHYELFSERRKHQKFGEFFSVDDIIDGCDGDGYNLNSSVGGRFLPKQVMEAAKEQIKRFLFPLDRVEFAKKFNKMPKAPRTECVWTSVEGLSQSTNDELSTCRRCREKNRVCLMRSSRSKYPIFVGLKEQKDDPFWDKTTYWMELP